MDRPLATNTLLTSQLPVDGPRMDSTNSLTRDVVAFTSPHTQLHTATGRWS